MDLEYKKYKKYKKYKRKYKKIMKGGNPIDKLKAYFNKEFNNADTNKLIIPTYPLQYNTSNGIDLLFYVKGPKDTPYSSGIFPFVFTINNIEAFKPLNRLTSDFYKLKCLSDIPHPNFTYSTSYNIFSNWNKIFNKNLELEPPNNLNNIAKHIQDIMINPNSGNGSVQETFHLFAHFFAALRGWGVLFADR